MTNENQGVSYSNFVELADALVAKFGSQQRAADALGIPQSTLSKMKNGKGVHGQTLVSIMDALSLAAPTVTSAGVEETVSLSEIATDCLAANHGCSGILPPPGTIGEIVGDTCTGKSYLALAIVMSVGMGKDFANLGLTPSDFGSAAYIGAQDPSKIVEWRAWHIANKRAVSEVVSIAGHTSHIVDKYGLPSMIMGADLKADQKQVDWLKRTCTGRRLVIIDPLSRFCPDDHDVKMVDSFYAVLERIAKETECSFIVCRNPDEAVDRAFLTQWWWSFGSRDFRDPLSKLQGKQWVAMFSSYTGVVKTVEMSRDEHGVLTIEDGAAIF